MLKHKDGATALTGDSGPQPAAFEFLLACRAFAADSDLGHMDEADLTKHLNGLLTHEMHDKAGVVDDVRVTHIMHIAGKKPVLAGREIDFTVNAIGSSFDGEEAARDDAEYQVVRRAACGGILEIEVLDVLSTTKIGG